MRKFFLVKITHLYDPTIRKIPVTGLCGDRDSHVPFWSMIYVALKSTLTV